MEKISDFLIKCMLLIFMFMVSLGILVGGLGVFKERPSYLFCFILGLLAFLLLLRLAPRLRGLGAKLLGFGRLKLGLIITAISLALGLSWILYFQIVPSVDFLTFYESARAIAHGEAVDRIYLGLFPHILGYSSFLGWVMSIFGESVMVAALTNLILNTVSGLCIYVLCQRHLSFGKAAFAYLLWALLPSKTMYCSMVLSEPLYTCLILLFLLCLSYAGSIKGPGWLRASLSLLFGLVSGILLMGINVTRPVGLILAIAFAIWALLLRGKAAKTLLGWGLLGLYSIGLALGSAGFQQRWERWEYVALQELPSSLPAYNIYVGLNPDTLGSYSQEDMDLLLSYRYDPDKGSARYAQEQMLLHVEERIKSGDINFPKLLVTKLGKLLGSDEGAPFYGQAAMSQFEFSFWSAICNVFYYLLFFLCIAGTWRMFRGPDTSCICLVPLYSIGLILAHMIVEVGGRYKYSLLPMFIILASCSLDLFSKNTMPHRRTLHRKS